MRRLLSTLEDVGLNFSFIIAFGLALVTVGKKTNASMFHNKKHRISKILTIGLLPFYFQWQRRVTFGEESMKMKITYWQ